jgi:hypothetical protein
MLDLLYDRFLGLLLREQGNRDCQTNRARYNQT